MSRIYIGNIRIGHFCRAPRTPYGSKAAKNENTGWLWSRYGQGEISTFDHGTLDFIGLVRVVKVVKAKFTLSRTRARVYVLVLLFIILSFLFDFIRNTLDHLDQSNDYGNLYLDHTFDHP